MMVAKGQVYEVVQAFRTSYMTHWAAPFSGGGDADLPVGTQFRIANDPPKTATAVYCEPLEYETLERQLVSREERRNPRYSGFSLVLDLVEIRDHCQLLSSSS